MALDAIFAQTLNSRKVGCGDSTTSHLIFFEFCIKIGNFRKNFRNAKIRQNAVSKAGFFWANLPISFYLEETAAGGGRYGHSIRIRCKNWVTKFLVALGSIFCTKVKNHGCSGSSVVVESQDLLDMVDAQRCDITKWLHSVLPILVPISTFNLRLNVVKSTHHMKLQIKVVQNWILYKKVCKSICPSPSRVELGGSKDWYGWNMILYWNVKIHSI